MEGKEGDKPGKEGEAMGEAEQWGTRETSIEGRENPSQDGTSDFLLGCFFMAKLFHCTRVQEQNSGQGLVTLQSFDMHLLQAEWGSVSKEAI